mmetsp:Transcript_14699/g.36979  ORF Transcript_14699/g.36979 Transcript_14699/m.36979 type:complete len:228 (+) Transcript_14699:2869-3552(+)
MELILGKNEIAEMNKSCKSLRNGSREVISINVKDSELFELGDSAFFSVGNASAKGAATDGEGLKLSQFEEIGRKLRLELTVAENEPLDGFGKSRYTLGAGGCRLAGVDDFQRWSVVLVETSKVHIARRIVANIERPQIGKFPQARRSSSAQKVVSQIQSNNSVFFVPVCHFGLGIETLNSCPSTHIWKIVVPAGVVVPAVSIGRVEEFTEDRALELGSRLFGVGLLE